MPARRLGAREHATHNEGRKPLNMNSYPREKSSSEGQTAQTTTRSPVVGPAPISGAESIRLPISAFIIALNEAGRIGRAIESVRDLCDEVVVIDSGSTDGTQALATSLGARVIAHAWTGYGPQKRFGEQACANTWRLNLDADEVLTPRLRDEIRQLFGAGTPPAAAYTVEIAEVFPGEAAPRRFAYCHNYVRLYHATAGEYSTSPSYDLVSLRPGISRRRLSGRIEHFSMVDTSRQINKFNLYTDSLVTELIAKGRTAGSWRLYLAFPVGFFKAFFLRRYVFRGRIGFTMAMNYAIFRYLKAAKFLEKTGRL